MIISISKNPEGWVKNLQKWVEDNYRPESKPDIVDKRSTGDDLSTIVFYIGKKFYGPVRQSMIPSGAWKILSRWMSSTKNAKKKLTELKIGHTDQYKSRCVLIDPQGTLGYDWWHP
jgi:hypothetical protein